jgi:hypothetical protein
MYLPLLLTMLLLQMFYARRCKCALVLRLACKC